MRKFPHFPGVFSLEQHVSISKARRILGTLADDLSDDQIQDMLNYLTLLAREKLWYNGSKKVSSQYESSELTNE